MPPRAEISLAEARRLALTAQGLDRPRPARVGDAQIARVIRQLGLVQIDYVNVLGPAQYFVPFSRLGPYDRARFDRAAYDSREFTEQWAHEASIVPMSTWPLLGYRMEARRAEPFRYAARLRGHREYPDLVLEEIRRRGPLGADDLPSPNGTSRRIPGSWVGTIPRAVLEAHFSRGRLAVAARRANFSRVFDLAERIVPAEHLKRRVERPEAQRELLMIAARAHGLGTAADLADYFRMRLTVARARLAELVEAGRLRAVAVEGWREPALLHPEARAPRRIEAATLLSPFDPLIWFRPRTARLFEFDYRFEIFVPQSKRRWGNYVLPFLLGDRLVARVDLKADRARRRLLVLGAYLESGVSAARVVSPLAAELRAVAAWYGLESVAVGRRGDLARALTAAVRARR